MKKYIILSILCLIAIFYSPVSMAQAPVGFARESNIEDWFEVCNPSTYSPYDAGFYPQDYLGVTSLFRGASGVNEFAGMYREALPQSFIDEGIEPYDSIPPILQNLCFWEVYVDPKALPGTTYELAQTPLMEFTHENIEYGDVAFAYYYSDSSSGGALWRPYTIIVRWDDQLETNITGTIDYKSDGYVSEFISPRPGHYIDLVWIEFPTLEYDSIADWLLYIPMPTLLIDQILIRGFYRTTPLSTSTPTPTRTPTIGPSPTQTTTPRAIWSTPTPGTPQPTAQFPPYYGGIPTRIPTVSFPDWDYIFSFLPPTPSSYYSIPLIDTPIIPTRAPFTFTIPISYSTPASFSPPTVTATPTVSGTVTATITPTATLTPTATATRADIVTSMNVVATNLYSEAAVMNNPTTFTIQSAPVDYAPALPRPMANVGYTFENMQDNIGFLYDPRAWASLIGYIASIPIQLVKFFHTMAQMMGPVGLFTTWLLILFPFVLFARMFVFIKNLIISIINLVVKVIRFIGDIWDLFPGL